MDRKINSDEEDDKSVGSVGKYDYDNQKSDDSSLRSEDGIGSPSYTCSLTGLSSMSSASFLYPDSEKYYTNTEDECSSLSDLAFDDCEDSPNQATTAEKIKDEGGENKMTEVAEAGVATTSTLGEEKMELSEEGIAASTTLVKKEGADEGDDDEPVRKMKKLNPDGDGKCVLKDVPRKSSNILHDKENIKYEEDNDYRYIFKYSKTGNGDTSKSLCDLPPTVVHSKKEGVLRSTQDSSAKKTAEKKNNNNK